MVQVWGCLVKSQYILAKIADIARIRVQAELSILNLHLDGDDLNTNCRDWPEYLWTRPRMKCYTVVVEHDAWGFYALNQGSLFHFYYCIFICAFGGVKLYVLGNVFMSFVLGTVAHEVC